MGDWAKKKKARIFSLLAAFLLAVGLSGFTGAGVVSALGGGGGTTVNVHEITYTFTVNYIDENGNQISAPDIETKTGVGITVDLAAKELPNAPVSGGLEASYAYIGYYYITQPSAASAIYSLGDSTNLQTGNPVSIATQPSGEDSNQFKAFYDVFMVYKETRREVTLNTENHMAYIIGYPNSTVRPSANITRAEVATIFFRLLTDASRNQYWSAANNYTDFSGKQWYNTAVSTMTKAGIISGYPNGTFSGERWITRAEFAAIAARFSSEPDTGENQFTDISGHWAAEYINRAAAQGWIYGYKDGTFQPNQSITRAEAMALVNRMLARDSIVEMHKDMVLWPDNPQGTWYYEAVQEATNSHQYIKNEEGGEIWTAVTPAPDWLALEKSWAAENK